MSGLSRLFPEPSMLRNSLFMSGGDFFFFCLAESWSCWIPRTGETWLFPGPAWDCGEKVKFVTNITAAQTVLNDIDSFMCTPLPSFFFVLCAMFSFTNAACWSFRRRMRSLSIVEYPRLLISRSISVKMLIETLLMSNKWLFNIAPLLIHVHGP